MSHSQTAVRTWLLIVVLMIWAMILLGGLTRLTGSGLSMVDWRPIMGAWPPLNQADWQEAFTKYQGFPQFQAFPIDLEDFKYIFAWEYSHRLLGRLIGLAFAVPFLWFLIRRQLDRALVYRLAGALVLGGAQGLLGWFMVKSGLVDMPRVSHMRLAAHLSMAIFLSCWLLWIFWGLAGEQHLRYRDRSFLSRQSDALKPLRSLALAILGTSCIQIVYGAFMAGLHAGTMYNTFPTMAGYWWPPLMLQLQPYWLNLIYNETTIQFIHRFLALLLTGLVGWYLVTVWRQISVGQHLKRAALTLFAFLCLQVMLGILTLIHVVPIPLASAHQMVAVLFVSAALYNVYLTCLASPP